MARAQKKLTKKELRQDPLMKTIEQTQGWLAIHGKTTAIAVIAVVVIAFGIGIFGNMKKAANADAMLNVAKVRKLLTEDNKEQAETLLKQTIDRYKGTQGGAEALYTLAELNLASDSTEKALELFNQFERQYGDEFFLNLSALDGKATSLENLERFEEAAKTYDKLVAKDKIGHLKPLALYNAGRCYNLAGKTDLAKNRYQQVIDKYEDDDTADQAERELALLDLKG
ncbi:tetratricopeptide repeat protein [bacterium]|nr:tetratricopeptide repeat protein [bacterium]